MTANRDQGLTPDAEAFVSICGPLDLAGTLWPVAHGRGDPTIRFAPDAIWRATRTADGPATLRLRQVTGGVAAAAWGPGAEAAVAGAAELVGASDRPEELIAHHPRIADVARRLPGLRLPRTNAPWEALLPAICEQKVTGREARAAYRSLVGRYGEPAPGPGGLRLAPEASALADVPYFALHPMGLERRRADTLRRAAASMARAAADDPALIRRRLAAVPGIGPWTLAEVARVAWGDPDAISVGDYHIPSLVAWALAGEPRADDARMLELLEPYRGQRGRVQRLLEASGVQPPRYGPRMAPQRIAGL